MTLIWRLKIILFQWQKETPMGIPHKENIEAYNSLVSKISSTFFIKTKWLYDFQSVDVLEVLSSTIGVVALFFAGKKKIKKNSLNFVHR